MRVLFVCTGNICRSPTADGYLRKAIAEHGLAEPWFSDSAGLQSYHVGESPDPRSVAAALRQGVDISPLRARQVSKDDFHQFDIIFAMDAGHLVALNRMKPQGATAEVALYLPYAGVKHTDQVPDPYYGDEADFSHVIRLVEEATTNLLSRWNVKAA